MRLHPLHQWPTNVEEARCVQDRLRALVRLQDGSREYRYIAGVDCSAAFWSRHLWATIVVIDRFTFRIVDCAHAFGETSFPYIPGFLTFREGPLVIEAFSRLRIPPDLLVFDGQGIAHPRGLGLAAHMGVWFDVPSIGCAKSHFFGDFVDPGPNPGDYAPLESASQTIGAVLRTRRGANPIFVSPGHKISVESARIIIWSLCRGYRLPEPTRLAHLEANRARKESRDQ